MNYHTHPTLNQLEKNNFQQKMIASPLKKCLKKLSAKSSADLGNLSALAYALYVFNFKAEAMQVCEIVSAETFHGDFQIWGPIEKILLLQWRLQHETGKVKEVQAILNKIKAPMERHEEALKRRLSLNWLSDATIERYTKAGDMKQANKTRFSNLGDLLFILALGPGQTDTDDNMPDVATAEKRFLEYKEILRNDKG